MDGSWPGPPTPTPNPSALVWVGGGWKEAAVIQERKRREPWEQINGWVVEVEAELAGDRADLSRSMNGKNSEGPSRPAGETDSAHCKVPAGVILSPPPTSWPASYVDSEYMREVVIKNWEGKTPRRWPRPRGGSGTEGTGFVTAVSNLRTA